MPHFFTDRGEGVSRGVYNSFNLAVHVGDDPKDVATNRSRLGAVQFMNQVHGDEIVVIDELMQTPPTCDALITKNPLISLAVMVADCIPLLLISKTAVAAVHVGRAGLVNQIAIKTVRAMQAMGVADIHAVLGPSICGNCYEVPIQMQRAVVELHPLAQSQSFKNTPALDLAKALRADLAAIGISYESSSICTLESEEYFSYRRDNPTGRFAGVVSL